MSINYKIIFHYLINGGMNMTKNIDNFINILKDGGIVMYDIYKGRIHIKRKYHLYDNKGKKINGFDARHFKKLEECLEKGKLNFYKWRTQ